MVFLIISSAALSFMLVLVCFSNTVEAEITKRHRLQHIKGGAHYLDEELEKNFFERYLSPVIKKLKKGVAAKSKSGTTTPKRKENVKLQRDLQMAGIHMSAETFSIVRLVLMFVMVMVGLIMVLTSTSEPMFRLLILAGSLMLAVLVPRYYLKSRIKSRQTIIRNQLPNLMDVLSVSIEAGLGFDAALLKTTESFKGPLVEEFSRVYREIQMGKSRKDALGYPVREIRDTG